MGNLIVKNSIRWIVLIVVQLFICSNLSFYNLSTPFIYILFILWLPFSTPNFILFLLSFATGCFLDYFFDTPGIHAAACTLLAFIRIIFINITFRNKEDIDGPEPSTTYMNSYWFLIYSLIGVLFHHTTVFLLEAYKLYEIQYTLIRILISSAFTLFLIQIVNFVFFKRNSR